MKPIAFAGIGARKSPMPIMQQMELIASVLGARGLLLRSGGAAGADTAFEVGCNAVGGPKRIYEPKIGHYIEWQTIAERFHPNWQACDEAARKLHARNTPSILGDRPITAPEPAAFVVCWTPGGAVTGGTGQALRIAAHHAIPVFNLALPGHDMAAVMRYVAGMGW